MDPLKPLTDSLYADGRPRIWSLVITVFGDSVQHRGGRIATARLGRLLGRIGVETGALRTALSRLAQDGWVMSRRDGRTSSYALTAAGKEKFAPATARIYATPRQDPVIKWIFSTDQAARGLCVAGGKLFPADGSPQAGTSFEITGTLGGNSALAVQAGLDPEHLNALKALAKDVQAVDKTTLNDPLNAAAARMLLIHRWRRLILRWPEVPAELMPSDVFVGDLRRAVAAQYWRLCPMAEQWLDSAEGDMAAMPPTTQAFAKRFGGSQTP